MRYRQRGLSCDRRSADANTPSGLDVVTLAQFKVVLQLVEPTVGMLAWQEPAFGEPVRRIRRRPNRVVCHERRRSTRLRATVREMKEGPSGSVIRSLIPSHLEPLRSKAVVVSVAETPRQ